MVDTIQSPYIHAATSENFKALVLDNSHQGPVLVNFWSRKAGPCLRQYPILDKLVHHYDGKVLLINVDTENEFVFTKEYGITSVPTLKLFRYGKVVETLHGYQSEDELIKVLDQYVARDSDLKLADAIELYTQGKPTEAYEMIANAIVEDPVNPRLPLTMCKLLKHEGRYAEAVKLINSLPEDIRQNKQIDRFHDLLTFYMDTDPSVDLKTLMAEVDSAPNDLEARQRLAAHYVIHEQYEQALQELVKMMETSPGHKENYAQKAMLKIFNILAEGHPLIAQFRPNLQRYTH